MLLASLSSGQPGKVRKSRVRPRSVSFSLHVATVMRLQTQSRVRAPGSEGDEGILSVPHIFPHERGVAVTGLGS